MFYGRKEELNILEKCYSSDRFEFIVLYGRRRIGKTSLLMEFASDHDVMYFTAQEQNDRGNLSDFAAAVTRYMDGEMSASISFPDWKNAFNYITSNIHHRKNKPVIIIDEFSYLVRSNPSIKSILQSLIDHEWKEMKLMLILCGSSVSIMKEEVLGYESPLFGRATNVISLKGFDYKGAAQFFPSYSPEEKCIAYGILGGVPKYLTEFEQNKSIKENITDHIMADHSIMSEDPLALLRMETREPAVYNSILEAIASGASHINEIATKTGEENSKCSKYLSVLQELDIVERVTPCGEKDSSRKSIYVINDNYFSFWYRFLFRNRDYYRMLGYEKAADEILSDISDFMGSRYEEICTQYMIHLAKTGRLPFVPRNMGRYWGNNPRKRRQEEIDILALSKEGDSAIFAECKFRNERIDIGIYEDLKRKAEEVFPTIENKYFYLFSKSGFTKVLQKEASDRLMLCSVEDMYRDKLPTTEEMGK